MKTLLISLFQIEISSLRQDVTLLIFRVLLAFSMLHTHGLKKIADIDAELAHIPDPLGIGAEVSLFIAVFANIGCTILVMLGAFTRLSIALILSVTLTGLLIVHANDPWVVRDVPFMYFLAFGVLLILGAGRYSVDHFVYNFLKSKINR